MLRKVLPAALAVCAVTAASTSAAQADSLVYLKGGQVWISHVDGSAARPVTTKANDWAWPSEADNGAIVAAGGLPRNFSDGTDTSGSSELYKLTQSGKQIGNTTDTPGSHSSPACDEFPPQHIRVSPDGTKAAYDYIICSTFDTTAVWVSLSDTSFRLPAPQHTGQLNFYAPYWFDNSRFLVTHMGDPFPGEAQYYLHSLGAGDNSESGPGGDGNIDLSGFQVVASRTGNRLAVFEADSASGHPSQAKIVVYTTNGTPGSPYFQNGLPGQGDTPMCKITLPASAITNANNASPTLSYDGTRLAWTQDDGIHVANVTQLNTGSDVENVPECTTVSAHLLIPGGSEPFFSHGNEAAPSPVAAFGYSPKHPRAGKKVRLNASSSHESGGKIVRYVWSFGDSHKKVSGRKVSHTFKHAGRFTVTLVVTDASGRRATTKKQITVK